RRHPGAGGAGLAQAPRPAPRRALTGPPEGVPMKAALRSLLLALISLAASAPGRAEAPRAPGGGQPPRPKPARVDRQGDPLPKGALARLGTLRFRHRAPVTFVGFSHDSRVLLSAGKDNLLRAWDPTTGRELWRREVDVRRDVPARGP